MLAATKTSTKKKFRWR